MTKRSAMVGLVLVSSLAGCKSSGPGSSEQSKIVQRVEGAGAGNLDQTDAGAMQLWFSKHVDLAKAIQPDCHSAAQAAPADWAGTTEGRVCASSANVAFLAPSHDWSKDYAGHARPNVYAPK